LFDVDVHPVAIDRTMRLEVEDTREGIAAHSLLVDRALNRINRFLVRLVPLLCEFGIFLSPAINRIARYFRSLCGVVDRTMNG